MEAARFCQADRPRANARRRSAIRTSAGCFAHAIPPETATRITRIHGLLLFPVTLSKKRRAINKYIVCMAQSNCLASYRTAGMEAGHPHQGNRRNISETFLFLVIFQLEILQRLARYGVPMQMTRMKADPIFPFTDRPRKISCIARI